MDLLTFTKYSFFILENELTFKKKLLFKRKLRRYIYYRGRLLLSKDADLSYLTV